MVPIEWPQWRNDTKQAVDALCSRQVLNASYLINLTAVNHQENVSCCTRAGEMPSRSAAARTASISATGPQT